MNKWTIKILRYPPIFRTLSASREISFPGFEGLTVWQVLRFFVIAISRGKIADRAAAVCFNLLLAVPPTLIVLISLVPYIPVENFNEKLLAYMTDFLPESAALQFSNIYLDLMTREHNTFLSISFILALYYASNSMKSVLDGFERSVLMIKKMSAIRLQFMALGLLFLYTLLMAVAMALISLSDVIIRYLESFGVINDDVFVVFVSIAKWVVVLLLFNFLVGILYNVGNPGRNRWRWFSPGATFATLGLIVVSLLFAWYVNNFGNYNRIYGSVGTILVVMLWLYFNIIVLLVGFELNASIVHIHGTGKAVLRKRKNGKRKNYFAKTIQES